MFPIPFVIATLIATMEPGAGPVASPSPLHEIGHVRASVCGNIIVHVNSAISSVMSNDRTLANAVFRLRNADFEGNALDRRHGIGELSKLATQLSVEAAHGDGEIKRLRTIASGTTDAARKAHLETFSDALDGALHRQQTAARDLSGFLAYLDYRDMQGQPAQQAQQIAAPGTAGTTAEGDGPGGSGAAHTDLAGSDGSKQAPNAMAQEAAVDFQGRMGEIATDESRAADHAEGAVTGC